MIKKLPFDDFLMTTSEREKEEPQIPRHSTKYINYQKLLHKKERQSYHISYVVDNSLAKDYYFRLCGRNYLDFHTSKFQIVHRGLT